MEKEKTKHMENDSNNIHLTIKALIDRKSKRDQKNFTIYQLAKAIEMPHSMLVKLIHVDPAKRVNNPRIDTLARIVDFFKQDGFDISIDDLFNGFKTAVSVSDQTRTALSVTKTIPIYAINSDLEKNIGVIDVKLENDSHHVISLLANEPMKPMFKAGSIFVIDTELTPKNDTLVAIKKDTSDKILIRKFYIEKSKKMIRAFDDSIKPIELKPTSSHKIIGVVIQINAKT